MPILIIQLAILIAVAFVIGCILGRLAKGKKAIDKTREDTVVAAALSTPAIYEKPEPVSPVKDTQIAEPLAKTEDVVEEEVEQASPESGKAELLVEPSLVEEVAAETIAKVEVEADRPELLEAPLRGKPDDLVAINGVGKAIEGKLQKLGVFHYTQVAQWSVEESGWIERHIGFAGRVTREDWVAQARKLVEAASSAGTKRVPKPKKAGTKVKGAARSKKKPVKQSV